MKKPSQVRSAHIGTRVTKKQLAAIRRRRGDVSMSDYLANLIDWDLANADIAEFVHQEQSNVAATPRQTFHPSTASHA